MQNNLRKVRFNKLVDRSNDLNVSGPCYAWQEDYPNEGLFHEWHQSPDEGPQAMIELTNGTMILIPCDQIRFVEPLFVLMQSQHDDVMDALISSRIDALRKPENANKTMTITLNPVLKSKESGNMEFEMYGEYWQKEMFKKPYSDIVNMAKNVDKRISEIGKTIDDLVELSIATQNILSSHPERPIQEKEQN
jgi:hypothetical protein